MSTLRESLVLQCPYHLARRYLQENIAPHVTSGKQRPLKLIVSAPAFEFSNTVGVTYRPTADPMHFDQPWHIHWKDEKGHYPEFDGELTVRADFTDETARLELEGSYRPPGGAQTSISDLTAGARVAHETARLLLQRIGREMEARHHHNERAKTSPLAT